MRTKKRTSKQQLRVARGQAKSLTNEAGPEETVDDLCKQVEHIAEDEAGSKKGADELLSDDQWLRQLLETFRVENGVKSLLVARIHEKHEPDGHDK